MGPLSPDDLRRIDRVYDGLLFHHNHDPNQTCRRGNRYVVGLDQTALDFDFSFYWLELFAFVE
jgi:Cu2+-containing amine oxidase